MSIKSGEVHNQSINQSINRGLPIGNLTSQFFANIYLNGLDHFIKEKLKCHYYLRYMDDSVVLHDDKAFLWDVKNKMIKYLEELKLTLNENKCRIYSADKGVPFLGMIVFPTHRRLNRQTLIRFKRRMKNFQKDYKAHKISWERIRQSFQSWNGHAGHANSWRLRELVLEDIVF